MSETPTPRTDDAWDAYARGAAGTAYVRVKMEQLERELTRTCTWTACGNTWRAGCGSVYGYRQGAYCPACGGRIGEAGK